MKHLLTLLVCTIAGLRLHAAEPLRYNRDVRPILAEACFSCHGPGQQKAGLRLDDATIATKPNRKSEATAIVPKKPDQSELIKRIFAKDDGELMPPPNSHKTLTNEQKTVLKRWISEGAAYEAHWAFTPIESKKSGSIDSFIDAKLNESKLVANGEADRTTLIRRVSFALTGLPPTIAEIDTYLADRSPKAYENMVDRYLASPHYGEEMARHWLDLARYADTHGLHLDNERSLWPYRAWVIDAFNTNKRFDTFTIEQLAGDLLPNPTREQLVATGFNRCNVSTGEGGSIVDEWHYRNAVERAASTAETWLGLTAGCAQCHDHKFDPFTAKDFYSLYAFFLSLNGSPLDGNKLLHEPMLKLTTPQQERELRDFDTQLANADAAIAAVTKLYVDPASVGATTGAATNPDAHDLTRSLSAWIAARGGPEKGKLPREITTIFNALTKSEQKPNANQMNQLKAYFLRTVCATTKSVMEPLHKSKETIAAERTKLDQAIPGTMIFQDAPTPRDAYVMARGQYDKPGEKVLPNTPSALPKLKTDRPRANRLDLANWLVSKENPLTARVYINRLWQQFFGVGLSKTSNDFGVQGEAPSHPELLDWLAADFRDHGWDIKRAVKQLILSKTFRRSSKVSPEQLQRDPENRWYARGPRLRLDAEQVRDNVLAVSGLLNRTIGGASVKPYQPENVWEPIGYTDSNTRIYKRDQGSALYRRTLYTFYKRTAPPPFMANFDAPNREQPCSKRDRSNTPLQALQLLNDVQHVEAARVFAERIVREGGPTTETRLTFAMRSVVSRAPTANELAILRKTLDSHLTRYKSAPADAKKLLSIGETKANEKQSFEELAAYTLVASMILNLDEALTRN